MQDMSYKTGYLTVYSADRSEIYGEFGDASWEIEETDAGNNHVFKGTASEGTLDTFERVNGGGIDHVAFDFESEGQRFSGDAQLLAPNGSLITVETGTEPAAVQPV